MRREQGSRSKVREYQVAAYLRTEKSAAEFKKARATIVRAYVEAIV
jgi:hypothetical protein